MLEGLEDVEWASLTHAYGSAENIPAMLQALNSAENQEAFEEALGRFINVVNHQGSIYSATPHVVPFLWQLLQTETNILRQSGHLAVLIGFLESSQVYHRSVYRSQRTPASPLVYETNIELHKAVAGGREFYISLLTHPAVDIRASAMYLLSFLAEDAEPLLTVFAEFVVKETDEWVRAGGIWAYARTAVHTPWKQQAEFAQQLVDWARVSTNRWSKTAAALGYLKLHTAPNDKPLPDPLLEILVESLHDPLDQPEFDRDHYYLQYDNFLPFDYIIDEISARCRRVMRPFLWIFILREYPAPPLQAHLLVRELLDVTFSRYSTDDGWLNLKGLRRDREYSSLIYEPRGSPRHYVMGQKLISFQRDALQVVVDYDPFWEIPTNLLSLFYHLPDSRDALRELIV